MKVVVERTRKNILQMRVEDGALHVLANKTLSAEDIEKYIKENIDWIRRQNRTTRGREENKDPSSAEETADQNRSAEMFSGKACMICGECIPVVSSTEKKVFMKDNCIYIPEKQYAAKVERLKALSGFVKKLAKMFLSEEISRYGTQISLCPARIDLRALHGESWINCGSVTDKSICLDYRAIQLPPELQKYLIAHAFSHFYAGNHEHRFWNVLSNYMPEYEVYVKRLPSFSYLKEIF